MTEGTAASMQPTPFSKWKKAVRVLRWIVVASLCSILCREFFVHWNDARAIRFLADGIPFFASLIVLFIPPLHLLTDRMGSAARLVCLIVGASWSAVWWQKELLADRAAQQAEKEM